MGDKRRLTCAVAAIAAAGLVGAVVAWLVLRAPRGPEQARQVRRPRAEPRLRPTSMPATQPGRPQWQSHSTYVDQKRRMISTYDTDGDGCPNYMELNLRQSPIAIDLAHFGARPRKVGPLPSGPLRTDTPTAGPDSITPSCGICPPVSPSRSPVA